VAELGGTSVAGWRLLHSPTTGAGCLAPNAGEEPEEGIFIVEAGAEVDPGEAAEETGKLLLAGLLSAGQQDRDHAEPGIVDARLQRGPHLLVLPGTELLAEEHRAGTALIEGLLQRFLPRLAGDEVPFVEERLEILSLKLPGEVFHGRLVGAGVAQEDVVAGHSQAARKRADGRKMLRGPSGKSVAALHKGRARRRAPGCGERP